MSRIEGFFFVYFISRYFSIITAFSPNKERQLHGRRDYLLHKRVILIIPEVNDHQVITASCDPGIQQFIESGVKISVLI